MTRGRTSGIIFIPLDVRWPRNRKVRPLIVRHGVEGLAAWSLYLAMACHCRENLTDGVVSADEIGALAYPLSADVADRLLKLLTDARLVREIAPDPDSPGYDPGYGDGYSPGYGPGYLVLAYVKRNGTRAETVDRAESFAEAGKRGARKRWSEGGSDGDDGDGPHDSQGYGVGYGAGQWPPNAQTETETETESSSPRVPAQARARANGTGQDEDDDDLDQLVVAMLTVQGIPCDRDQAAAIRARILGRRNIAPASRRPYIERALSTPDGARKWGPPSASAAARHPSASDLDPVTRRRAEMLRTGQTTLDADVSDDPHARAAEAREMLANRPPVGPARPDDGIGELHGEALARAQLAEAAAMRARDHTGPADAADAGPAGDPDEDEPPTDGEPEPDDEPPPGEPDEYPF